jgi:5-methyltetrahydrofolate--homocysteine methyltransferase
LNDVRHTLVIGERINPTGRKKLASELMEGRLDIVLADARRQADAGADIIDINVGIPGIDEGELLLRAATEVSEATGLPVCIDSSDPLALAAVVTKLPAGTLVNSVTGDKESMDPVLEAAALTGASVIGMAKDHAGIPSDTNGRLEIASRILERAGGYGIPPERLMFDFLTIPVATDPGSALVTLECIEMASAELGAGSVLGVSNISFGMPSRNTIHASFLAMAILSGLSAAIVNPLEEGITQSILAADALVGKDARGGRFLRDYRARLKQGTA